MCYVFDQINNTVYGIVNTNMGELVETVYNINSIAGEEEEENTLEAKVASDSSSSMPSVASTTVTEDDLLLQEEQTHECRTMDGLIYVDMVEQVAQYMAQDIRVQRED